MFIHNLTLGSNSDTVRGCSYTILHLGQIQIPSGDVHTQSYTWVKFRYGQGMFIHNLTLGSNSDTVRGCSYTILHLGQIQIPSGDVHTQSYTWVRFRYRQGMFIHNLTLFQVLLIPSTPLTICSNLTLIAYNNDSNLTFTSCKSSLQP